MPGPSQDVAIGANFIKALPSLKGQAKVIAQAIKDTKREIKEAGSDAQKVDGLVAKLKSQVKTQQDIADKLGAEKAGSGGFSGARSGVRNSLSVFREVKELSEGKISGRLLFHLYHHAEKLVDKAEEAIGEKVAEHAEKVAVGGVVKEAITYIKGLPAATLAGESVVGVAAVGAIATLGVYYLANSFLEEAKATANKLKADMLDIGKTFARQGSYLDEQAQVGRETQAQFLKQDFADFGAINPGNREEMEARSERIKAYATKVAKISQKSYRALQLLRDDSYAEIKKDFQGDFSNVRGEQGLRQAFLNGKSGLAGEALADAINQQIERDERLNQLQKSNDERLQEADPSYAPRMRQRNQYINAYEKELSMQRGEWTSF